MEGGVIERIKKNMRPGDVLLTFNRKHFVSKGIAEITDSDFSHAVVYVGMDRVIEATSPGVILTPVKKYLDYDKYFVTLRRPFEDAAETNMFVSYLRQKLGIKYGYLQFFMLALLYLFGLRREPWIQLDLPGIICSELVAKGMKHVGWYPFKGVIPANVVPGDLANRLPIIV